MRTEFDVAVVGLGAMGSMTLWQLAEDGVDAIGFEQFGIGHDRGAVGGETRLFRRTQTSRPEYTKVIDLARDRWAQLQEFSDVQILTETGGLVIGQPGDPRMVATEIAADTARIAVDRLSTTEMNARFPEHHLDDGEIGIYDPSQGYLRCEQAVLTAVRRAKELGAQVYDYTKPTIRHTSHKGVVLSDGRSEWRVKKAILATGAWSHDNLTPELRKRSRAGRIKLTWFSPKPGHNFTANAFPVFQRLISDGTLYGAPSVDGGGSVKIAPGGAPTRMSDPSDYFRGQSVEEILYMEKHVERYFPGLNKSPIRAGAWTDFYVEDGIPFLGHLPHSKNILLANGFAGFGFKMCPGIGRIAADLIQGKTEPQFKFMEPTRSLGTFSSGAK